jgi:hypothetical protein
MIRGSPSTNCVKLLERVHASFVRDFSMLASAFFVDASDREITKNPVVAGDEKPQIPLSIPFSQCARGDSNLRPSD